MTGNTDLKGAYIASTADPSKNQLTTSTLTRSDIENHSEYSANTFGAGGGATVGNGGANERRTGNTSGKNAGGISPMLPQIESCSERAATRAGVSEGTITLTDEVNRTQDLASLNRDTADLKETVTRTPDLQDLLSHDRLGSTSHGRRKWRHYPLIVTSSCGNIESLHYTDS